MLGRKRVFFANAKVSNLMRESRFLKDTGWVMLSQGVKLVLQLVYFVLVARALGVRAFGEFAASLALVSVLSPFAALGTGNLLVMHVARRPEEFRRRWGTALAAIPSAGILLSSLAIVIAAMIPALRVDVVATLCVSEIFFNRLADTAGQAFQAFNRFTEASSVWMLVPFARALGSVAFAIAGSTSLVEWTLLYGVASGAAALVALVVASTRLGRPTWGTWHGLAELRNGLYFSVAQSAASIYSDIDKTMLAQLGTTQAAGVYAAAYRFINVAFVPAISLFQAAYARFFRAGESGVDATRAFARRLTPLVFVYGVVAGLAMYVSAPLIPFVLGSDYASSVGATRWLAGIPLVQSACYLAGDVLTGAGRQGIRTTLHVAAAVANVGLNLVLIPLYSWRGAAWATTATFILLACALQVAVRRAARAERAPAIRPRPALDVAP